MIEQLRTISKDIFNELGSGHSEAVYQKAFEVALRLEKIHYENQRVVPIFYKEHNVGEEKPDIIADTGDEKIVIELKAVGAKLSKKEETQVEKYLEVMGIKKGILINFPQPNTKETPTEPEIIEINKE